MKKSVYEGMRTRLEVERSLKFARTQRQKAERDMQIFPFESAEYEGAVTFRNLWQGYINAYESVLQIEAKA